MERYTVKQRIKMIQAYYQNGCSKRNAFRALCENFDVQNQPSERIIRNVVHFFETTGTVSISPNRGRLIRSGGNVVVIRDRLNQEPEKSDCRRSQHMDPQCSSAQRLKGQDLKSEQNNEKPKNKKK